VSRANRQTAFHSAGAYGRAPRPGYGFTLVELVAAATLTVLVTGSTVAILRSTAGARQRVDRQMALQQEARVAVNTIATALRNAHRTGGQTVLEGTDDWLDERPADRVRFFTVSRRTVREGRPESDVRECEFALREPTDGSLPALMRRTDPTRNEAPDVGGVVELVAENVLGLDLAYHDGVEWRQEWAEKTKGWPTAIRIRVAVLAEFGRSKVWTAGRIVNFPGRPGQGKQDKQEEE